MQERIEEGLKVVKITVERIRKMILNIIYYAKERGLNWNQVDMASFCDEVSTVIASKMENKNIEFVKDFDLKPGKCEFDDEHIHSALINILENAVDACEKDKSKKSHKIIFNIKQQNDHLIFEISDDGIGMDSETLEKIFTPFSLPKAAREQGSGSLSQIRSLSSMEGKSK